jgi:uncharacterized membrane protein
MSFLRKTAIGGLFFLLPLAVVVYLLGQIFAGVSAVAKPLHEVIPVNTPVGIAMLFCVAIALVILGCFAAGVVASRAIGQRFSTTLEKQLATIFPKYTIYKDLLAGNLNHGSENPSLKTILIANADGYRLAFESERLSNGMVVVFLPGSPDAWIGSIQLVPSDRVYRVAIDFNTTVGIIEQLGRNSKPQLDQLNWAELKN